MRSLLKPLSVALVAFAFLISAGSAAAATYTVTRTDDPNPAPCEVGNCSLRGALTASNATTSVDDVVVLPASAAPYLLQYEFLTFTIKDEVEVEGAGANQTVVKGDGQETIFYVEPGVKATLSGLTITGGTSAIQSNGELLVRGVAIEGNEWNGGTAGIITNGPLTVESSFLGFNRTISASGGAIHTNAPATIVNSTIAHNTSKEGPGAISTNAAVTLVNSAVVSNRSEVAPAAAVGGSPLTLRNTVFADNRNAAGILSCFSLMPITSQGGNVSDDGSCGTGATDKPNVNPLLGSLDLHGGTTKVYELLAGSPAIDAGSDCPSQDQRGVSRPQGSACDSGPYEYVPPPPASVDKAFFMKVGKKFRMTKGGLIRARLTCPKSEISPPCKGSVAVMRLPSLPKGDYTIGVRPSYLRGFTIWPGKTKMLILRPVPSKTSIARYFAKVLAERKKPWKVSMMVSAKDAAGNTWTLRKRRVPLLAKRG